MAVPTHFRFSFRGIFEGTPEQWQFGFHISRDVDLDSDAGVGDIHEDDVTAAVDGLFATGDAGIPSTCVLTDWRAYEIGTNGLMENNPLVHVMADTSVRGATSPVYPPQIAYCVTTVAANRGPARFGRFYLPTALPIATTGDARVTVANALAAATAYGAFIKAVADAVDLPGTTLSAKGLNISASGVAGARQEIDHIECGRVLDTLRNRRKSLDEDRQAGGHLDW